MKRRGFTIVELLLIMSLIFLFSSIVFVSFPGVKGKARIAAGLHLESSVYNGLGAESLILLEFDEGSGAGIVEDISGYNNHGIVHGPSFSCVFDDSKNTPSGLGCSLDFNGINDYVEISHSKDIMPSEAITISFWLYLKEGIDCSEDNNWRSILYKSAEKAASITGYNVTLEKIRVGGVYTGASLSFDLGVAEGDCGSLINRARYGTWGQGKQYYLPEREWTHIVFTYSSVGTNPENADIYINGQWIPSKLWGLDKDCNPRGAIKPNNFPLFINTDYGSACPSGDGGNFPGKIDNFRIYGEALNRAAIEQMYANDIINKKILAKNYNSLLDF